MPDEPDGYVIENGVYRNLRAVMTRLYNAGDKPLSRDDIRDLANIMEANLSKAQPVNSGDTL